MFLGKSYESDGAGAGNAQESLMEGRKTVARHACARFAFCVLSLGEVTTQYAHPCVHSILVIDIFARILLNNEALFLGLRYALDDPGWSQQRSQTDGGE